MKRILAIFLVLLLSLSMVACSDPTRDYIEPDKIDHNEEVETDYFEARILEVYEKSIVVEPIDGSNASKSSDKIDVTIDGVSVDFDLVVGGIVGITYAGSIVSENPDKNTKEIEPCLRLEIPFYNKKGCFEFLSFNSEKKSILKVSEKESKNCAVYGYGDILFLVGILQSNSINLAYNLYKDKDLFNGIQALYLKKFDKKLEGKFKISTLVSIDSKFKDKNIGLMKQVITVI